MCNKYFCSIVLIGLALISIVNASCLEYGHSCWGAHGKRSGNTGNAAAGAASPISPISATIDGGKLLRTAVDLRNDELNASFGEDLDSPPSAHKALFERFDELVAPHNRVGGRTYKLDEGDSSAGGKQDDYQHLANYFGKVSPKFRNVKEAPYDVAGRFMQQQQHQHPHPHQQQQQQQEEEGEADGVRRQWRNVPLFPIRRFGQADNNNNNNNHNNHGGKNRNANSEEHLEREMQRQADDGSLYDFI